MATKYNTEDIVKYINRQMDDAEAAAFKRELDNDTQLAEKVSTQRKLSRLVHVAYIKQQLDDVHQEYVAEELIERPINYTSNISMMWGRVAAAAVIAGIGLFIFLYQWRSSNTDKIFAANFRDDTGSPSLMGNKATPFDEAMVYYKSADYQTAEDKFKRLLSGNAKNDTVKYFSALCQVRLNNEDVALQLLSSIAEPAGSELGLKAKWYSALILIHQKRSVKAIPILSEVKNSTSSYSKRASTVLAELKTEGAAH